MVKNVVKPARISVVNRVFLSSFSYAASKYHLLPARGYKAYMTTAFQSEDSSKRGSTDEGIDSFSIQPKGLHGVDLLAKNWGLGDCKEIEPAAGGGETVNPDQP